MHRVIEVDRLASLVDDADMPPQPAKEPEVVHVAAFPPELDDVYGSVSASREPG
jgi:hypothetical protein